MDNLRRELATVLNEVAELYPEWRFGQLVENVAGWAGTGGPANIWDVSDVDLLNAAKKHLNQKHASAGQSSSK